MKKLFTFMSLMAFTMAMNAQDPSKWEIGQNVAEDLGLKELGNDFSGQRGEEVSGRFEINSIGNVWQGTGPNEFLPGEGERPAVFGFYNLGKTFEFYQIVRVPAGSYTFAVNAMYREGTPADNFKNMWKGKKFKYGHMFANIMADDQTTVTYYNDLVIKSIAQSDCHERIHFAGDNNWMNDYEDKHTVDGVEISTWCPSCCEGFGKYFAQGYYLNEKNFIVTEDAYVKIGFAKTGSIPQDCIDFSNIKIIYQGPVTAQGLFDLANEEFSVAYEDMSTLAVELEEAGFEVLANLLSDYADELDEQAKIATKAEELAELKEKAVAAIDQYKSTQDIVNLIADMISSSDNMLETSDFIGKETFVTILNEQRAAAAETDIEKIGDPVEYYTKIVNALSVARADYLNSQETIDNAPKDFTSLIKYPWFVNTEYTPVDDSANGGDYWHLTAEGWTGWEGPETYDKRKSGRIDICSNVDVSIDPSIKGQWFKYQDHAQGWCDGTKLFHHGRLIGFSTGWAQTFKNPDKPGIEGVAQRLVGLPNGYYSVSCLVRGWDAQSDYNSLEHKFLGCFAENSQEVRVSSNPSNCLDYWWEWGSSPQSWDDKETSVLLVEDGKLLIGGGGSISHTVTGFRLKFHGTDPNFPDLAMNRTEELRALISEDYFEGDKKILNDLLNSVKHPVSDAAAYEVAFKIFGQFSDYQAKVAAKMKNYTANTALAGVPDVWAAPAHEYFNTVAGKSVDDTYEKADEYNALANAYKNLNDMYTKIENAGYDKSDAKLKSTVTEQQTELAKGLSTTEIVNGYAEALKAPFMLNEMKAFGCENATAEKPVKITSLMNNPSFDESYVEGQSPSIDKSGWSGVDLPNANATNQYARGNVELWNKDPFDIYQKIENLPAGTYKLRVKAIYRDGKAVTPELKAAFEEAGSEENWANHNAVLYAKTSDENTQTAYIKSIYRINQTSLSFTEVAIARTVVEGNVQPTEVEIIGTSSDPVTDCQYWSQDGQNHDQTPYAASVYPFDTQIGDNYYPASMYGFYMACQQHPEAVTSEVTITIEDGETLQFGIKKDAKISEDWVIFDDFELEYLSGESFARSYVGVDNVTVNATENGAVFNMAGQRVGNDFKGIVIKNGVKVLNK